MMSGAFLDAAEVAKGLLREPGVAAHWSEPSALAGYSTGGLARHLAYQVTHTVVLLAAAPGGVAIPLLEHYTGGTGVGGRELRHRHERTAVATTPTALVDEFDAALSALRTVLPAERGDRVVDVGDWGLAVDDFLTTRVLELVVHADDLAVTVGVPTPALPAPATDATIQLLAGIAAWRHGALAVVRGLARRERAPATISAL